MTIGCMNPGISSLATEIRFACGVTCKTKPVKRYARLTVGGLGDGRFKQYRHTTSTTTSPQAKAAHFVPLMRTVHPPFLRDYTDWSRHRSYRRQIRRSALPRQIRYASRQLLWGDYETDYYRNSAIGIRAGGGRADNGA